MPTRIAAAAIVVMIGSASNLPTRTPWIAPITDDIATARTRATPAPRCSVVAKRIVVSATVAGIASEKILPTIVIRLRPTAMIPTSETERQRPRRLVEVAEPWTATAAIRATTTVAAPITVVPVTAVGRGIQAGIAASARAVLTRLAR